MKKQVLRRIGAGLSSVGVAIWLSLSVWCAAFAAGDYSLTIHCQDDTVTLSDMRWNLYLVGEYDGQGAYQLTGVFAGYPVSLADTSASALQDAADTLENYAVIDGLTPLAVGVTDENGTLTFDGLGAGVYLLSGEEQTVDGVVYEPSAVLMSLPNEENEMDLFAFAKFTLRDAYSREEVPYSVSKIWANDDTSQRPAEIQVALYQDETLFDTVTLNDSNNWAYSWVVEVDGETASSWRVEEVSVPEGYTVVYRSGGTDYVIVNTYEETVITTAATETVPSETTTLTTVLTTVPTGTDAPPPAETTTTQKSGLPQTGQLWWPVPLLGGAGIVMILIGMRLQRTE